MERSDILFAREGYFFDDLNEKFNETTGRIILRCNLNRTYLTFNNKQSKLLLLLDSISLCNIVIPNPRRERFIIILKTSIFLIIQSFNLYFFLSFYYNYIEFVILFFSTFFPLIFISYFWYKKFKMKWIKLEGEIVNVSDSKIVIYVFDGRLMGWKGVFGGTKQLYKDMLSYQEKCNLKIDYLKGNRLA